MNFFIVPSWYPSPSNPSYGIFIKEQIAMLARHRPDWKIGVSTWGQGDQEKLLWIKDHFQNLRKLSSHANDHSNKKEHRSYVEYYQPALSWSKRFRKGNLREIIRCNELNYQAHTLDHGKPDVIMVQASYPGILIGSFLSKKYHVPVHLHVRLGGFMFEKMLSELSSIKRNLLSAIAEASLVTVTSNFHGKEVEKWIPEGKIIYNPVDNNFFQPIENTGDFSVAIGRLESEKGFDLLIEAVKNVENLNLKIIGSGSQESALKRKIDQLSMNDRIEMLGEKSREEVRNYIQKSQFLVLPSRYETFGNVLLEAMACGKPVVSTKCGGSEEIVTDQIGYLCQISEVDLAEKLAHMLTEHGSFSSRTIRKKAEIEYAPDVWANRLESMLKAIV